MHFGKYIVRLDDACPTQNHIKWSLIEDILDKYDIKPIVAVIPNNKDNKLKCSSYDNDFWSKVREWQKKNWHIALHGYDHLCHYTTNSIVPINEKSEFTDLTFSEQCQKLEKGLKIFSQNQITTRIWVAPSHAFDLITLKALEKSTDINTISDGIALFPFKKNSFNWIPQQLWHFRRMLFGVWTICFHPNTMNQNQMSNFEKFIKNNAKSFIDLRSIKNFSENSELFNKIFSTIYFKLLKSRAK